MGKPQEFPTTKTTWDGKHYIEPDGHVLLNEEELAAREACLENMDLLKCPKHGFDYLMLCSKCRYLETLRYAVLEIP